MNGTLVPVRQSAPAQVPGLEAAGGQQYSYDAALFEEPGVHQSLLKDWLRALGNRYFSSHQHVGDVLAFPRSADAVIFLTGMEHQHIHDGPQPVRNPLAVMRPPEIAGYRIWAQLNGGYDDPIAREKPTVYQYNAMMAEERLKLYAKILHAYDQLVYEVAEALNLDDSRQRLSMIAESLERNYSVVLQRGFGQRREQTTEDTMGAHRWLVLVLLSLLDHPDDRVTLLGRLRALECLRELDAATLAKALGYAPRSTETVLQSAHRVGLPWSYMPAGSDFTAERKIEQARANQRVQQIWVRTSSGKTDWTKTANRLIHNALSEAVQLTLLFMQCGDVLGGLVFLQSIPALHRGLIANMLNERASFRVEHKLAAGVEAEVLIGTGQIGDVREERVEDLDRDQLIMLVRQQQVQLADQRDELAMSNAQTASLAWQTNAGAYRDPLRFYWIHKAHPLLFEGITHEKALAILDRLWKLIAPDLHPDTGTEGTPEEREANFKLLQRAHQVLKDPVLRRKYDAGELRS